MDCSLLIWFETILIQRVKFWGRVRSKFLFHIKIGAISSLTMNRNPSCCVVICAVEYFCIMHFWVSFIACVAVACWTIWDFFDCFIPCTLHLLCKGLPRWKTFVSNLCSTGYWVDHAYDVFLINASDELVQLNVSRWNRRQCKRETESPCIGRKESKG